MSLLLIYAREVLFDSLAPKFKVGLTPELRIRSRAEPFSHRT